MQKREGEDWFAVFNPNVQRVLDVELVHNLQHESVVCCVRFSHDGRFIATGCNRAAQIYDVESGRQVTCLQDDSVEKDGDLYIRSVCFSPDGRYLATGAEDKLIRVSSSNTVSSVKANSSRFGTLLLSRSRTPLLATSKIFILSILHAMASISLPVVAIAQYASGILTKVSRFCRSLSKTASRPLQCLQTDFMWRQALSIRALGYGIPEGAICTRGLMVQKDTKTVFIPLPLHPPEGSL